MSICKLVRNQSMDKNEVRPGYSKPHWRADEYCVKEGDNSSSIRIPVRALNIVWGNDSRYWQWIHLSEQDIKLIGMEEGGMLVQVNWIEVTGKLTVTGSMEAGGREYEMMYLMKFEADAFGWHSAPLKFKVKVNEEVESVKSVLLESYKNKPNQWHEICGGVFSFSSVQSVVEFGMFEDETDWWKGGLVLGGISIRPKVY